MTCADAARPGPRLTRPTSVLCGASRHSSHGGGEHQRHRVVGALGRAGGRDRRAARPTRTAPRTLGRARSGGRSRNILSKITGPAPERGQQQQEHHQLDDDVGLQEQPQKLGPAVGVGQPHGRRSRCRSIDSSIRARPVSAGGARRLSVAKLARAELVWSPRCGCRARSAQCASGQSRSTGAQTPWQPVGDARGRSTASATRHRAMVVAAAARAGRARAGRRRRRSTACRTTSRSSSRAGRRKSIDAARTANMTPRSARLGWAKPRLAQHLGPAALGEAQVVGVIDDAGRVGVLVVDAHRLRWAGASGDAHGSPPLEQPGLGAEAGAAAEPQMLPGRRGSACGRAACAGAGPAAAGTARSSPPPCRAARRAPRPGSRPRPGRRRSARRCARR